MGEKINCAISTFAEKFDLFKIDNAALLASLSDSIEEHSNKVAEILDDYADDLKSTLGSEAANETDDSEDAQECAISAAEEWVTNNISNGDLKGRIAIVLWLEGIEVGEATLRNYCAPRKPIPPFQLFSVLYF